MIFAPINISRAPLEKSPEALADLRVKCQLDLNPNWNVLTNFNMTSQYQIELKSFKWFFCGHRDMANLINAFCISFEGKTTKT
jgi:hypothetical protein